MAKVIKLDHKRDGSPKQLLEYLLSQVDDIEALVVVTQATETGERNSMWSQQDGDQIHSLFAIGVQDALDEMRY